MPSENIFNTGLLTPKKNSKISRFTTDNDDIKHLHTPKVSPEKELKGNDEAFSNTSIPNAKTIKALVFDEMDKDVAEKHNTNYLISPRKSPNKREKASLTNEEVTLEKDVVHTPLKKTKNNKQLSPFKSPTKKNIIYNDRFLPSKTGLNSETVKSLRTVVKKQEISADRLSFSPNKSLFPRNSAEKSLTLESEVEHEETMLNEDEISSEFYTEHFVELQKQKQKNQVYDVLLKNEIFGSEIDSTKKKGASNISLINNSVNSSPQKDKSLSEKLISPIHSHDSNMNPLNELDNANDEFASNQKPLKRLGLLSFEADEKREEKQKKFNSELYEKYLNSSKKDGLCTSKLTSLVNSPEKSKLKTIRNNIVELRKDSQDLLKKPMNKIREIPKVPYRVLDAPGLTDDFYLNLIDWSKKDWLGVVLDKKCFLTHESDGAVVQLADLTEEESVYHSSIKWSNTGEHIALGLSNGITEVYDMETCQPIRTFTGHTDRVGSIAWNNHILTTGSRDSKILHRDLRAPEQFISSSQLHMQEVCGLAWNINENKLASGGNDNSVFVYDNVNPKPTHKINEHTAAVKALAWSPHTRGVLATGGGSADKRLKIWNINNSTKIKEVDTGSQICNIIWSELTNEIITSHGFSRFHLTCWDYETLSPIAILKGHTFRVLHLALSSDGTTVVSGAGDETLRFWKLFEKQETKSTLSSRPKSAVDIKNKTRALNKTDQIANSLKFLR